MNILVVGAGDLGGSIVMLMRDLGATITLMDFEYAEGRGAISHRRTRGTVSPDRSTGVMRSMHRNFGVSIVVHDYKLTTRRMSPLDDQDLVVTAVEDAGHRQAIADHCWDNDIPCLHGIVDPGRALGLAIWNKHWMGADDGPDTRQGCERQDDAILVGLAAASIATEAQLFASHGEQRSYEISTHRYLRIT